MDFSSLDNPTLWILAVIVVVGGIFLIAILTLLARPQQFCPNCRRRQIPGQQACPFCGANYSSQDSPAPLNAKISVPADVVPGQPAPIDSHARLVWIQGEGSGQEFPLRNSILKLGRSKENDIALDGLMVSRFHAEIRSQDGYFVLRDLDSTNGSYVNDQRIAEHVLEPGDQIQIGENLLVFQWDARQKSRSHLTPAVSAIPVVPLTPAVRQYDLKTYQMTHTIGSGGAATVFRGVSLIDHSTVAIKILHEADPFIREKFVQEGEIGKSLQHQRIAKIIHHGEADGVLYIIMEYVDGGSLRQRLSHGKPTAFDFTRAVIGQTCEALAYAHSRNVIHRDIKPENILLSTEGGVKLVDFGIAKLTTASSKTSTGIRLGTPYYMSYEQACGLTVTPMSDIYALGIVLYEMLTGQWPFQGQPLEVIHKHMTETPVSPRQFNPNVPPEMEAAVVRALDKKAERRFQNAMDFARAIGYQPNVKISVAPLILEESVRQGENISGRLAQPRLLIIAGRNRGRAIPLYSGGVVLGRNDLDSDDQRISRKHFQIGEHSGEFTVQDLDSMNGTFVNGSRITTAVRLRENDKIQVGGTVLRFES